MTVYWPLTLTRQLGSAGIADPAFLLDRYGVPMVPSDAGLVMKPAEIVIPSSRRAPVAHRPVIGL